QLKAKVELLQHSRTADVCAQQAIDALPQPPGLHDELAQRLRSLGAALLVHVQLDAGLGAHSHRLRDAIRSVEQLLDVHPEVSAHWRGIKKVADRARHEPLVAESAGSAEQEQDLVPVVQALEVVDQAVELKEHAAALPSGTKALDTRCTCGALAFSSRAGPAAGAPRETGTPRLTVKHHFEFRTDAECFVPLEEFNLRVVGFRGVDRSLAKWQPFVRRRARLDAEAARGRGADQQDPSGADPKVDAVWAAERDRLLRDVDALPDPRGPRRVSRLATSDTSQSTDLASLFRNLGGTTAAVVRAAPMPAPPAAPPVDGCKQQ
ncbi:unnamed protein product, partial [Prorocentrum cordatum]